MKWPAVTAVEPAPDGSIYVVARCFENSCAGRSEPPILKYNRDGKLLATFGQNMFDFPHGATVDRDGNLWVTDARGANGKGHQVFKFSPHGQGADDARQGRCMPAPAPASSISRPTSSSRRTATSSSPTAIAERPTGRALNNRVVKFTRDGKFVKEWGKKGSGQGEMSEPHTIAMDSRGRLFVGDRENNRIQIFDQDGKLPRRVAPVRAAERHLHHAATTRSTWPIRSQARIPARASCPASRRGFASAARATAALPRSSRTWSPREPSTQARKEWGLTPPATSMVPWCGVRCSSATSANNSPIPIPNSQSIRYWVFGSWTLG